MIFLNKSVPDIADIFSQATSHCLKKLVFGLRKKVLFTTRISNAGFMNMRYMPAQKEFLLKIHQGAESGRIILARALKIKFAASSSGNLFSKTIIVVSREGK